MNDEQVSLIYNVMQLEKELLPRLERTCLADIVKMNSLYSKQLTTLNVQDKVVGFARHVPIKYSVYVNIINGTFNRKCRPSDIETREGLEKHYLLDVVLVDKEFRRRGVAKSILEVFRDNIVKEENVVDIIARVTNEAGKGLLSSLGFKEYKKYVAYSVYILNV